QSLAAAADHLAQFLRARRAQLPPGHVPADTELAWRALAEHVRRQPDEADLLTLKLDSGVLQSICRRRDELRQYFEDEARRVAQEATRAPSHPGLDAAWNALEAAPLALRETMSALRARLCENPQPSSPGAEDHWAQQEAEQLARLDSAIALADRLLQHGDLSRIDSGQALFDLLKDMLEQLEWRDRIRMVEQKAFGANLGPLTALAGATGVGVKLILSGQKNSDHVLEFYMGRTGLYVHIGRQKARQYQFGAGVTGGPAWELTDEFGLGVGGSADWRVRFESGVEDGVQLRIPRRGKGEENELRAQFMDMFEHLVTIASPLPDGTPARRDWLLELFAHHPSLTAGLIEGARRRNRGTELNLAGFFGMRAAGVVNSGVSLVLKNRQDEANSRTQMQGYLGMLYRESAAQARKELSLRATAGVRAAAWHHTGPLSAGQSQRSALRVGGADLAFGRELSAQGLMHFCTLFTFDNEIDPVRSDRAIDFQNFKAFERELRREWSTWVHYGTSKLPDDLDEPMRYAVAEQQLENLIGQAKEFFKHNKFATVYVDKAMKAEVAPFLDALRAMSHLHRIAGRTSEADHIDRLFDDVIAEAALWEPTIVLFREKTKLQNERGIDFFLKLQRNRIAESMRTVGQWILYEPVPHPEPGQEVLPAGRWKASLDEQLQAPVSSEPPPTERAVTSQSNEGDTRQGLRPLPAPAASGPLRRSRSAP
ncbi:MAG TPA: hypothetical protein VFP68_05975, partial [Burkholderiaceae bacterium]|nr:hypothetical protein [Burkholderiaceae bacterium]